MLPLLMLPCPSTREDDKCAIRMEIQGPEQKNDSNN